MLGRLLAAVAGMFLAVFSVDGSPATLKRTGKFASRSRRINQDLDVSRETLASIRRFFYA
jgi:hypothetical protein